MPQGRHSIEAMLHGLSACGAEIGVCGSCMNAPDLTDAEFATDCKRSSMAQLAAWTVWGNKVIVF